VEVRRVVTKEGHAGATFAEDRTVPRTVHFRSLPGFETCLIWADDPDKRHGPLSSDTTLDVQSWLPNKGGSRLLMVTFPPDAVWADPTINPIVFRQEQLDALPGLAEQFEDDAPGMHRTPTLDYAIVLEGEIWLELDNGEEKHLKRHDIAVQTGTRHAWRNKGSVPTTMLFAMLGV
jgi:mannose-6-phosphate isomerase-like protein (cupin superfamily)